MKLSGNQRRMYLLALVLMVIAVALACTWSLWRGPADAVISPGTNAQAPQGAEPSAPPEASPARIMFA